MTASYLSINPSRSVRHTIAWPDYLYLGGLIAGGWVRILGPNVFKRWPFARSLPLLRHGWFAIWTDLLTILIAERAENTGNKMADTFQKIRVLVIDDDLSSLAQLKAALSTLGLHEVTATSSVEDAIQMMERKSTPFDCLMLGIQMPDVNSVTLCKELRKLSEYRKTPIIMLTTLSEKDHIADALAAGATDYITKPFDMLDLRSRLGMVATLIDAHSCAKSSRADAKALKDELALTQQFDLDDPVAIENVTGLMKFADFENYVFQLSQGALFSSFATAVKIANVDKLHGQVSAAEFRLGLFDVATAISRVTRNDPTRLCYRGNGVFLSICHRRNGPLHPGADSHLNQVATSLVSHRGACPDIHLVVGQVVSMRAITKYGSLYALNKAVDNVEARAHSDKNIVNLASHIVMNRSRSPVQGHSERGAYKTVLDDVLREEPRLRIHGT